MNKKKLTKKTILVTGAGGYIGSMLVPFLLKSKFKVIAIDRFFFGDLNIKKNNKNLTIIRDDVRNLKSSYLNGVYAVIDLAAISNDVTGERYSKETFEINFKARFKLAQMAKQKKIQRYILPSSASNYGKIKDTEIATENFKLNPLTNYSKANAKAEKNILELSDDKFCVVVLRQGTVYGYSPKMRFDLVINRMAYEAWKNNKLFLMKDGTQRRPTLHIKDAIRAMKMMLIIDKSKINKQIFNVGCEGNNISILKLADILKKQFNKKLKIEWYGSKDYRSYYVSFDKITKLGFKGKFKPEDGINEIVEKLDKKIINLHEKTITLDWYEKLEYWKNILDKILIKDKLLKF